MDFMLCYVTYICLLITFMVKVPVLVTNVQGLDVQ